MKVGELIAVLRGVKLDREIRIGDQIEAGPYEHTPVGGVYEGTDGALIFCGDPDAESQREATSIDCDLVVLWKPEEPR